MLHYLFSFLGGFGLGAIISVIVRIKFDRKKFLYEIKLEKYSSFFKAYQKAVVDKSGQEKFKIVAVARSVQLVAPDEICKMIDKIFEQIDSIGVRDDLMTLMRKDLYSSI